MLEIKDLHASINGKEILKGINLTVKPGEVHAIMGPNGSGKSTLLKCMNRILKINQGSIEINERSLSAISPAKLSQIMAYIPQTEEARTGLTVFDTVLLGRKPYISGKPSAHDLEFVLSLIHI